MAKYRNDGTDVLDIHSIKKHDVLKGYIRRYLEVYSQNQQVEKCRIDIVDGFSGCGKYQYNGQTYYGSPIQILRTIQETCTQISQNRHKPFIRSGTNYFVDEEKKAISLLKESLEENGYHSNDNVFYENEFEKSLDGIISQIKVQNKRSERVLFFLDPYGYKEINIQHIRKIASLKNSEIIWVFMADYITDYISHKDEIFENRMVKQYDISMLEAMKIKENIMSETKNNREYAQQTFAKLIRERSGFPYIAYLPIFQITNFKSYMVIHLCKRCLARGVMVDNYWINSSDTNVMNHDGFTFYNPTIRKYDKNTLFSFSGEYKEIMRKLLPDFMLKIICENPNIDYNSISDKFAGMHSSVSQKDIDEILRLLISYNEIEMRYNNKKIKDKSKIDKSCFSLSRQKKLFEWIYPNNTL